MVTTFRMLFLQRFSPRTIRILGLVLMAGTATLFALAFTVHPLTDAHTVGYAWKCGLHGCKSLPVVYCSSWQMLQLNGVSWWCS